MMDGESVVKLFIAQMVHSPSPAQKSRHPHPDEMVDHRREDDGHEMMFTAFAVESFVEIVGLFPGAKLNLPAADRASSWLAISLRSIPRPSAPGKCHATDAA